jgi:uncharacterized membrane protein
MPHTTARWQPPTSTIAFVVWLFAAAAVVWLAALLVAPFLPASATAAIYGFGSLICHQRPDRSFDLAGFQLPVCGRCIGIYCGAAVGALLAPRLGRINRARTIVIVSVLPALLSLGVEWSGLIEPTNGARAVTGFIAGGVIAAVVLATLHYEQCAPPRPIAPSPPPTST